MKKDQEENESSIDSSNYKEGFSSLTTSLKVPDPERWRLPLMMKSKSHSLI